MYQKLKSIVRKILPKKLLFQLEPTLRKVSYPFYKGAAVSCNICEKGLKRFETLPDGDLLCPNCGSISRVRRLAILSETVLKNGAKVLDFSPSRAFYRKLKQRKDIQYFPSDLSGDFISEFAFDITKIGAEDISFESYFDVIFCYHILEHILADSKAMEELFRVLAPDGKCFIQTPFKEGEIYEDDYITSETDRRIHFGQEDHVRIYSVEGLKARLIAVGFKVEILRFEKEENSFQGLNSKEVVLVCRK